MHKLEMNFTNGVDTSEAKYTRKVNTKSMHLPPASSKYVKPTDVTKTDMNQEDESLRSRA